MILFLIIILLTLLFLCAFIVLFTFIGQVSRPRVIFSMTTIPSRLTSNPSHLTNTITTLLNSTVKPDHIYLNIPHTSIREKTDYNIPESIYSLENKYPHKFTIIRCDDYGPLTKIYPTLWFERDPSTIIFLLDDDEIYNKNSHNELLKYQLKHSNTAFGYRGVQLKNKEWITIENTPTDVDILETYAGVVYKREFFNDMSYPNIDDPCFYADDLWIAHQVTKNGYTFKTLSGNNYGQAGSTNSPILPNNFMASIKPLSHINITNGNNQRCAQQLFT